MSGCKRLGAHDREKFGDSNCSLPLEMIIFKGQSVQNTSRMLKNRLRRLLARSLIIGPNRSFSRLECFSHTIVICTAQERACGADPSVGFLKKSHNLSFS